ncbi:carbohydrate ABC transporter substrate-binding protein [Yangia mangrovi]|uniref:Carbohydrate ABC transporter substrate-binding protein n=1 Tax=Alloyangia mangrovi TaxID=1779329 RepID=A0A2A3K2K9_9RHOB|nr:ABC transporter substrate-binding protein [Alloyangia mangrovi]MCT4371532.1 carbohydrate ABC transporter substrate-binding protein [Alloyangia mangrovi]
MKSTIKKALLASALVPCALSSANAADLRMSWWGGDSRHIATQEALKVCGEKYGHTIAPEFTGFAGYLEKLTTQMAGGTEADLMQVNWPWLPLFSRDGTGFADLQELGAVDLSQYPQTDLDGVTVKDHVQGIPVSTTGRVFFFNTTTLEEAGLSAPTTWEEFFGAAEALRDKEGDDYRLFNAVSESAQLLVSLAVTQKTGKDMVDPATNRVAWTPEELTAGIEFYQRMVDTGAIQSRQDEAAEGNVKLYEKTAWAEGKIAGSYEWDSTYFKFSDPLQDGEVLTAVPMVTFEDAVTEGVYRKPSMLFAISKHSKNPEAAAEILNCLVNEPEGIDALGDTRGLPASKVALERLQAAGQIKPELLKAHEIMMASEGPAVSPFNEHPELRATFVDTLEEFAYDQVSAEEAAEYIIEGANDVLSQFD